MKLDTSAIERAFLKSPDVASRRDLARKAGKSYVLVTKVLNSDNVRPSTVRWIATALGVDPESIIVEED